MKTDSNSNSLKIIGIAALFGLGVVAGLTMGTSDAKNNKPLVGEIAYAEETSDQTLTESIDSEIPEEIIEEETTETYTLTAWDKQQMAKYYRELYGPKIVQTVNVDGYEFNYIKGAPSSVYNEMARQAKLEEERIAREEELARQREAERQAQIQAEQEAAATEVATASAPESPEGYTFYSTMELTAYMETGNCCADGVYPQVGYTCACNDPNLWHRWIYIEGYGTYYVHDTGGMASNVVDIYLGTYDACIQFGRQTGNVYIVN